MGEQNDAHEFLNFIFNSLNSELLHIQNKLNMHTEKDNENDTKDDWEEVTAKNKTMKTVNNIKQFETSLIIGETFQGIIKQNILQKGTSLSTCQLEPFFILSFAIGGHSIDDIFHKHFSKQRIEDSSNQSIQTFLEKSPSIFIIHIKGFYYDKKTFQPVKINTPLAFTNTLTVHKAYFSPSLRNKDVLYDLIGIIVHKGTKTTEGHYVCYCKDTKNQTWSYIDDKKVIASNEDAIHSARPYVLFYRKK